MNPVEVIRRARDGEPLGSATLQAFVAAAASGAIADYQVTAWLMAVCLRGLSTGDTVALTHAMARSGRVLDWSSLPGPVADKHSTGGVGDKISLCLAPWVAACGLFVPMLSGRGLGHTGGTLDKLESIPGFQVERTAESLAAQLAAHRVAIFGQSPELAPADRIFYRLRDVTATVESIPLITSSILSKKIAAGVRHLVVDVKVGSAAFMPTVVEARQLARSLVEVGNGAGLDVLAVLTAMDEPIGRAIGNGLEAEEAFDTLLGRGDPDVDALTLRLGGTMLVQAGLARSFDDALAQLHAARDDGRALAVAQAMVAAQGGDPRVVTGDVRLPRAPVATVVRAQASGWVTRVAARTLGLLTMELGAGRRVATDPIDPTVGIRLDVRSGSEVVVDAPLMTVFSQRPLSPDQLQRAQGAVVVGPEAEIEPRIDRWIETIE